MDQVRQWYAKEIAVIARRGFTNTSEDRIDAKEGDAEFLALEGYLLFIMSCSNLS